MRTNLLLLSSGHPWGHPNWVLAENSLGITKLLANTICYGIASVYIFKGIHSMVAGSYNPRCLKRYYFSDEVVDQLHLSDRIFQHILLKQLKPTFKHIMNPNCYHLDGSTGVKYATERIKQVLQDEKPKFLLRLDIKSYYASIPHFKLSQDIKKYYHDPKMITMLENIITNPIDTPRGCKNPSRGIPLRGPLSQFFSGIFLKPLDDALSRMNIFYFRFQDDVLVLCKTKRQFNRCRKRVMEILHERQLILSRKKSRMGLVKDGFHFLGVSYSSLTQPEKNTKVIYANDAQYLDHMGGGRNNI
jgi:retron-type reverse transcriptase